MTCGDGMTEGLGRVLAVRTKQEASGVTVAISQPEHAATLPVAPAVARKKRDLTISDIIRMEDLEAEESENLPRVAANDTASRVLPVVETQQLAVCCGGSMQEHQAPEATPALKAPLVSTVSRRNSMKWRTFVLVLFSIAIGCLYGINSRTNEKVNALTDYYLAHEFSPEALNGKTYLEVTPQVEDIGINRFIPVVRQMPYTDAATLERLFNKESWVVAETWGESTGTVIKLNNWYTSSGWLWPTTVMAGGNKSCRSVLIHPHPVSLKAYADAKENGRGRIYAKDFAEREHYAIGSEGASRLKTCAEFAAPITREELAKLGNMNLMWDYGKGILFLTERFGAGERFVRLTDDDYYSMQARSQYVMSYDDAYALKEVSWNWWNDVTRSATKEEQTAVK